MPPSECSAMPPTPLRLGMIVLISPARCAERHRHLGSRKINHFRRHSAALQASRIRLKPNYMQCSFVSVAQFCLRSTLSLAYRIWRHDSKNNFHTSRIFFLTFVVKKTGKCLTSLCCFAKLRALGEKNVGCKNGLNKALFLTKTFRLAQRRQKDEGNNV